jgi:hypothetical protein
MQSLVTCVEDVEATILGESWLKGPENSLNI